MIPAPSRSRLFAFLLVAALALSACGEDAQAPAATVGGNEITQAELTAQIPLYEFLSSLGQSPCGQPTDGEPAGSACARLTLGNMIQQDVIATYAQQAGITVPDERVSSTIQDLETQLGGAGELDKLLKDNGVTRAELTELAGRLLLMQEVQQQVGEERVSDDQLRADYEANLAQYTQLHARHILLGSEDKARQVAEMANAKNFEDLATKLSTDPSAKQNGGDLGTQPASTFDPAFSQAALALGPGEISQPVQTQFGWHVIQLVSSETQPFEQIRPQLVQQAAGQEFQTWFKERLDAAQIEVNPRYGRFDPATGLISPVRSTEVSASPSAGAQSQPTAQGGSAAPQP